MKINKISIYVLNYNGEELLQECLPSIQKSVHMSQRKVELFVIDNESTDKSLEVLASFFPNTLVRYAKNRFLCSFNEYAIQDDSNIVILTNNDIKVSPDFIEPIVEHFEKHEDAFVVSSLCLDFSEKNYEGGLSVLHKKYGWWGTFSLNPIQNKNYPYTASVGACIAFRKDRFAELQGFDDLYLPGTLEDLDICYRGWKRGWKAYFAPQSVIFHKGQASFKTKFGSVKIRELAVRNTFLFIWKNINDPSLLLEHFLFIVPHLIYAFLRGDMPFIIGCVKAFSKFKKAWHKRKAEKKYAKRSDRQILEIFKPLKA